MTDGTYLLFKVSLVITRAHVQGEIRADNEVLNLAFHTVLLKQEGNIFVYDF